MILMICSISTKYILLRGRLWIRQGSPELIKRVGGLSPSLTHSVYNNWQIKQ